MLLNVGDKVPADLRLLEAHSLSADEPLTGESVPQGKTTADSRTQSHAGRPGQHGLCRHNDIWSRVGITVTTGQHGVGQDLGTGHKPILHGLSGSPAGFSRFLGVAGGLVAVVFILGVLVGYQLLEMFLIAITLAVSAIRRLPPP